MCLVSFYYRHTFLLNGFSKREERDIRRGGGEKRREGTGEERGRGEVKGRGEEIVPSGIFPP